MSKARCIKMKEQSAERLQSTAARSFPHTPYFGGVNSNFRGNNFTWMECCALSSDGLCSSVGQVFRHVSCHSLAVVNRLAI